MLICLWTALKAQIFNTSILHTMIERVIIKNYKCIKDANIEFNTCKNIIVGNNSVGKSTLMEAISLALGFGTNKFEVTPYVFNLESINEFKKSKVLPEIIIEVYFSGDYKEFSGCNNTLNKFCNGLYLKISFNELYRELFETECKSSSSINLPCEYYKIERYWFSQEPVVQYKMPFCIQIVDTTSQYFSSSSTQYINQLIERNLTDEDTISIKTSLRHLKERFDETNEMIEVNNKVSERKKGLKLSVDITTRIDKRDIMYPLFQEVPVSQTGAGEICHLKALLALGNTNSKNKETIVIIEEPESHLSHTKLYEVLYDIERNINNKPIQLFITTHNSFVANKMDLSNLILLNREGFILTANKLLGDEYIYKFFSKACHYPTLRLILSKAVALVEGPADEMVVTYYYYKKFNKKHPFNDGIELIAVGGIAFKAYVKLASLIGKSVAIITDNDGLSQQDLLNRRGITELCDKHIKLYTETNTKLNTLEPSFIYANTNKIQELSDFIRNKPQKHDNMESLTSYMVNNKSEWSYKLLENIDDIDFMVPEYISQAIEWIRSDIQTENEGK